MKDEATGIRARINSELAHIAEYQTGRLDDSPGSGSITAYPEITPELIPKWLLHSQAKFRSSSPVAHSISAGRPDQIHAEAAARPESLYSLDFVFLDRAKIGHDKVLCRSLFWVRQILSSGRCFFCWIAQSCSDWFVHSFLFGNIRV